MLEATMGDGERRVRMAVVGAGGFGRNHLRVIAESPHAELVAAVDLDPERARQAADQWSCLGLTSLAELPNDVDAAVVAVPTTQHVPVGVALLHAGIDVLIEKPIAPDLDGARELTALAERLGRVLQVGHLERFNPAVQALRSVRTVPLFFEIHRLSPFTPRSLDVDVVLDLMIHDLDLVLSLTGSAPDEVRAAGISILSSKVDIANVRLAFPDGCVANLTASRVSTERVRKLRLFQPRQYLSLDYAKQQVVQATVVNGEEVELDMLPVQADEPLRRELEHFIECVRTRSQPEAGGPEATAALGLALHILAKIEEHAHLVSSTLAAR